VTIPVACSVTALSSAISTAPGGAILVLRNGCVYGLGESLPDVTSNLTIQGSRDTIAWAGGGSYTALNVVGAQLIIIQLTLRGFTGAPGFPGALKKNGGTVTITNSTFAGDKGNRGGAILNNQGGTLTATSTAFTDNDATWGAGLYDRDNSTATLNADEFLGNTAGAGGAIFITTGHVTVTGPSGSTFFTGNKATADDGVIAGPVRPNAPVVSDGGAIDNDGGGLTVSFASFAGNTAEDDGGAIENDGGTATVSNSGFTSNSAEDDGGAIDTTRPLNLSGDTISRNRADDEGGGIRVHGGATSLNMTVIFGSSAGDDGGGIYLKSGTVSLANRSLVTVNQPDNCTGLSC
jgi:predicted outer membrane repeat protein